MLAGGRQRKIACREMTRAARGVDIGSRRKRVGRAIFAAKTEEHQLGAIVKLNTHPIPAGLIGFQHVSEEFVVHPRAAGEFKLPALEREGAARLQARERNVVRGAAGARGLGAHAVYAMNHRRFGGGEIEPQLELAADRFEPREPGAPVSVPDDAAHRVHARQPRPGAIDALGMMEAARSNIGQCQVRQIKIGWIPDAARRAILLTNGLPEKSQLETKAPALRIFEIPGPIPPFGAKLRMRVVIARELVAIAWLGHGENQEGGESFDHGGYSSWTTSIGLSDAARRAG